MTPYIYCDFYCSDAELTDRVRCSLLQISDLLKWPLLTIENNHLIAGSEYIKSMRPDNSWVANALDALNTIDPAYVFVWFDDLLFVQQPSQIIPHLLEAYNLMKSNCELIDYIRVNALPPPIGSYVNPNYRRVHHSEGYQCALPASIWTGSYLAQTLKRSDSVWEVERLVHTGTAISNVKVEVPYENARLRGHKNVTVYQKTLNSTNVTWKDILASNLSLPKKGLQRLLLRLPALYHFIHRGRNRI